jgi:methyltransferase
MSDAFFIALVLLIGLERLVELVISRRNVTWSLNRGGREVAGGHYPAMVALHTALLLGCIVEVLVADRPFRPWLGWPMLLVVLATELLRWWCIATLGRRWNTRIVVVPDLPLVKAGPYRWFRHPNYVAVVAEGIALPLIHTAWVTALVFTALNAWLLTVRVRAENAALAGVLAR